MKKNKMEENTKPEDQDVNELQDENMSPDEAGQIDIENSQDNNTDSSGSTISEEEKLRAEVAEWQNKHLRLYAEFDNFKRRTSKERLELLQIAGKDVIVDLLPVLDDFERAQKSMETATDIESVKEGVKLVHHKLKNTLGSKGLKEMEAIGKEFDADVHEGITNIPAPSDDLKGKVIDELEKGYYLNDKVIRFAKVIIGS
ncbi:MAG: nucleotide exchange factor GrpE [Daejeonella sp.]|uniref:nucleotide exchange factor GrpE n=1 Tax=Daejeonella sp. TaxID=2805397 RepID=UPI003C781D92